jgi:hypothetical protein
VLEVVALFSLRGRCEFALFGDWFWSGESGHIELPLLEGGTVVLLPPHPIVLPRVAEESPVDRDRDRERSRRPWTGAGGGKGPESVGEVLPAWWGDLEELEDAVLESPELIERREGRGLDCHTRPFPGNGDDGGGSWSWRGPAESSE